MASRRKQAISRQINYWNANRLEARELVELALETQDVFEEEKIDHYTQTFSEVRRKITDNATLIDGELNDIEVESFKAYLVEKDVEGQLKEITQALKALADVKSYIPKRGNVMRVGNNNNNNISMQSENAFDLLETPQSDAHTTTHSTTVDTRDTITHHATSGGETPIFNNGPTQMPSNTTVATRNTPNAPQGTMGNVGTNQQTHAHPGMHQTPLTQNTQQQAPASTGALYEQIMEGVRRLLIDNNVVNTQNTPNTPMNPVMPTYGVNGTPQVDPRNNYGQHQTQLPFNQYTDYSYNVGSHANPMNNRTIGTDNPDTCQIPWKMAQNDDGINVFNRFNSWETRQRCERMRHSNRRLTEAEIDSFNGEAEKFRNFWVSFRDTMAIDCVSDSAKFECLKRKCSGAARRIIDGYPVTSEGFEQAVTALFDHYDDDEVVAHAAMTKLTKLKRITQDYSDLEEKFGEIRSIVIELTARRQTDNIATQNMILDKFPEEIKTELGNSRSRYDVWNTTQMMKCLAKIVHARAHGHRIRTLRYEADASIIPCIFCNVIGHRPSKCKKLVGNLETWKHVITHRRCQICFETGHDTACCPNGCCAKCGSFHNTVFCNLLLEGLTHKKQEPAFQRRFPTPGNPNQLTTPLTNKQMRGGKQVSFQQRQFGNTNPSNPQNSYTRTNTFPQANARGRLIATHNNSMPKTSGNPTTGPVRQISRPDKFIKDGVKTQQARAANEEYEDEEDEQNVVEQTNEEEQEVSEEYTDYNQDCGQEFFRDSTVYDRGQNTLGQYFIQYSTHDDTNHQYSADGSQQYPVFGTQYYPDGEGDDYSC